MATLKNFIDQIVIDNGLSGNVNFPASRITRMVNLAQRYVQMQLNGLGMKKWENSLAITTGLGQKLSDGQFAGQAVKVFDISATIPSMAESPKAIKFIEVSDTTVTPNVFGLAFEIGENNFLENVTNSFMTPTVKNSKFMRLSGRVFIAPNSITNATIHYYKTVQDLVNDNDISEVPQEFDSQILKSVQIELDAILGKLNDKQSAINQLDKDIASQWDKFLGKQAVNQQANNTQQLQ